MAIDAQKDTGPGGKDRANDPDHHEKRLKKVEDQMAEFRSSLEELKSDAAVLKALRTEFDALRQEMTKLKVDLGQEWVAKCLAEDQESLEKSRLELERLQEVLSVRREPAEMHAPHDVASKLLVLP